MQPRPPAHEPPSATPAGNPLAPGGPHPPETIRFALEPFTTVVQGCTYRTEPATLVAKRAPAAEATLSPPLSPPLPSEPASVIAADTKGGSRYGFQRKGRLWNIVFDGGQPFNLKDTLGIRYLDYLLHRPNELISAFNLEVAITPEKGEARAPNSIQPPLDGQAKREYRQTLRKLQATREQAQASGNSSNASRLAGEIEALESALKERGGTADAGERARLNVHKAIKVVLSNLLGRGEDERAFAKHIREAVSLGYKCLYNQPRGRIWG